MLEKFVPDEVVNPIKADSEVGKLAARVFELGSELNSPNDVTKALGLEGLVWNDYSVLKADSTYLPPSDQSRPGGLLGMWRLMASSSH